MNKVGGCNRSTLLLVVILSLAVQSPINPSIGSGQTPPNHIQSQHNATTRSSMSESRSANTARLSRTVDVSSLPIIDMNRTNTNPHEWQMGPDSADLSWIKPIGPLVNNSLGYYGGSLNGRDPLITKFAASSINPPANSPSNLQVVSHFDGINAGTCACTGIPPDVQVAVGQTQVIETVNVEAKIFSKQGNPIRSFTLASFFNSLSLSDPSVQYDGLSNRWFLSILDITNGTVRLAVSNSSDPSGWRIYDLPKASFPDRPTLGVSSDKVIVSVNDFGFQFVGAHVYVINKGQLLSGFSSVDLFSFGPLPNKESLQPVQSLGPTTTEYIVTSGGGDIESNSSTVQLYSVAGLPPGNVTIGLAGDFTVSPIITMPPNGHQLGIPDPIVTNDFRVEDAAWFNGRVWFGLNTGCIPPGDGNVHACVRLFQLDTTKPSIWQDVTLGTKGMDYFYPTLRIDNHGGLGVLFGYSSNTNSTCCNPSLALTGQAASDPAGSLIPPITLKAGPSSARCDQIIGQGKVPTFICRYGDYFGAAVDPSDPTLIWAAGEYGSTFSLGNKTGFSGSYSTFIGSMKITGFSISANPSYQTISAGSSGSSTITLTSLGGFAGNISIFSSVSPTGPTLSLNPTTANLASNGTATFLLTITTTKKTPSGIYNVTVTPCNASRCYATGLVVTVGPDFSIRTGTGTLTVQAGASATAAITISSLNGLSSTIALSTSTPVSNILILGLNPASVTVGSGDTRTSTLTVTTMGNTPGGRYTVSVIGTGGGLVHPVSLSVVVQAFGISASPTSMIFPSFTYSANSTVRIVSIQGFSGTVSFSATSSPAGMSLSFSPTSSSVTANATVSSTLAITSFASTTPGSYAITSTGAVSVGGTLVSHSIILTITTPHPYLGILANPSSAIINLGSSTTIIITVTSLNKFAGNATLLALGSSNTTTTSLQPQSITLAPGSSRNSTLSVFTLITNTPGDYTIRVVASSSAYTWVGTTPSSIAADITITAHVVGFLISANPGATTVFVASSGASTISIQAVNGYSGTVTISANITPSSPNSPRVSLNPTNATLNGGGASSVLTISTSASTGIGTYTITVNATGAIGGKLEIRQAQVSVTVPPPDFSASPNPAAQSLILAGPSTSAIVTLTSLKGFSGNVTLTCSTSSGPVVSLSSYLAQLSPGKSINSTLSISAGSATPGTYIITATGTSGSLVRTATVTLTITGDFSVSADPTVVPVDAGSSSSGSSTITATSLSGFAGTVDFSGLPNPIVINAVAVNDSSTRAFGLTIDQTLTSNFWNAQPTSVIGTGSGSFYFQKTPSISVPPGLHFLEFGVNATNAHWHVTISVSGVQLASVDTDAGHHVHVGFQLGGVMGLPSGGGWDSPVVLNPGGSGSMTLIMYALPGTVPGNYSVTVIGTSGGLSHSVSVILRVSDFAISVPSSVTQQQGSASSYPSSAQSLNGFSGNLTLSSSNAPLGMNVYLVPSNVLLSSGTSGSFNLTISPACGVATGTYTLTITGTTSRQSHSATVSVTITFNPACHGAAVAGSIPAGILMVFASDSKSRMNQ